MACPNKLELIRYEKAREILRDGSVRENEFAIPVEHSVTVCVNGREVMEISCTGQYLLNLTHIYTR